MIRKLIECLAELGIQSQEDPKKNQNIRAVNIIGLLLILAIIPHMLLSLFFNSILVTLELFTVILCMGLMIFLNSRYYFNLARVLILLIGNFHLFYMTLILGIESGTSLYYYTGIIVSLFFHSREEWKYIVCYAILSLTLALLAHYLGGIFKPFVEIPSILISYYFYLSVFGSLVITFLFVFYFFNESYLADKLRKEAFEDLKMALSEVKRLSGLLPICASCKKIRDDKGYWNQLESYIRDHSEVEFSHGICPDCKEELYPELAEDEIKAQ